MKLYFLPTLTALSLSLLTAHAASTIHYVDVNSASPAAPYTSWTTAAADIQSAVDAASAGDQILVTNGVYATGGRVVGNPPDGMSNRVAITKAVTVQSVNGPAATVIQGYQVPGTTYGDSAVRCVYLNSGSLIGFTLTNGGTRASMIPSDNQNGGGIWCSSQYEVVSNCVIIGNAAYTYGGGAYQGALYNCTLSGNSASDGGGAYGGRLSNCSLTGNSAYEGGGADIATLTNCVLTGNSATSGGNGGGAYLSQLYNCTLSGNSAGNGGGAFWGTMDNCVLAGNSAGAGGGAAYLVTLNNCSLSGNSASSGGGAYGGSLTNCTVVGNSAFSGGGGVSAGSVLNNCIVYFNTVLGSPKNYDGPAPGVLNYCCTTPMPETGTGNFTADPQLASACHLTPGSPCRAAGSAANAKGLDIDGEPWANPPSVGCDEFYSGGQTGLLTVAIRTSYTYLVPGFPSDLAAVINGHVTASRWEFEDGTVLSNRPYASRSWTAAGDYPVVLRAYNDSFPDGVAASVILHVGEGVHHVALNSVNPVAPYISWSTAATNIQDAVDAAYLGGTVVVSNGVYSVGGRTAAGALSNRVAVTKPLTLQSLNGPAVTVIQGYQMPGVTNGDSAVRCVYLASGAALAGFTLSNGATRMDTRPFPNVEFSGGGVWCESGSVVVSNCVLSGNSAATYGGGANGGALKNCTLTGNTVANSGFGGGGAAGASLMNCTITGNFAPIGGGVSGGALTNCVLAGNSSSFKGGGASGASLVNCALTGNLSSGNGGGVSGSSLINCILYYNSGANANYYASGATNLSINFCCTTPLPTNGVGNFTNAPLFVDQTTGSLRLMPNSPCINAGKNTFAPAGLDLDGNPRIVGGTVDVGAYEFQFPVSAISYAWLQQYGWPTDGSADNADPDGDGLRNWQEWRAGTNPTNAASCLRLLSPAASAAGVVITWPSVSGVTYFLDRSAGLMAQPPFQSIATGLPGQAGTTSFTDTNATGPGPWFYRVGVQ